MLSHLDIWLYIMVAWCSALFSFQRTPAILSGAVRLSWISSYILPHPFRLVKNFLNLFSQALSAVWDSAAGGSCARGCLPPTCNILHGCGYVVNTYFAFFIKNSLSITDRESSPALQAIPFYSRSHMGLSHESIFVRIAPFSLTSITVIWHWR